MQDGSLFRYICGDMQVNAGYRDILKIAIPVMVGSLANNVVILIDTAFLNRVGETQQAAAGLASVFFFILVMTGLGLMNGMQIQIGRKAGEGNPSSIGHLFVQGLLLSFTLAAAFFLVLTFAGKNISGLFLHNAELAPHYFAFLNARKYGLFFAILNTCFTAFFVGISHTRVSYFSTVTIAIVNIVLDYLMIFGHAGFPRMGVAGAAWATNIAEIAGTAILCIYMLQQKFHLKFNIFKNIHIDITAIISMVQISAPIVFQYFISLSSWFFFFVSIQSYGTHALAISNNLRSIYIFAAIPCWGFGTAASTMVSNLIGQKRVHDIFELVRKTMILNLGFVAAISLLLLSGRYYILHLYTDNISMIYDSYPILYSIVAAIFMAAVSWVHVQAVTGIGSTKYVLFTEVLSVAFYIGHVILTVHVLHTSLAIVWLAEALYFTVAFSLNYYYLHARKWLAHTSL